MKERQSAWTTFWGKLFPICKTGFVFQTPIIFINSLSLFSSSSLFMISILSGVNHTASCCYLPASLEAGFQQCGEKLDLESHLTMVVGRLYITEAIWMTGSEVDLLVIKCLWAICFYVWVGSQMQKSLEHLDWQQRDLKPPLLVIEETDTTSELAHLFSSRVQSGCGWEDFPDREEI